MIRRLVNGAGVAAFCVGALACSSSEPGGSSGSTGGGGSTALGGSSGTGGGSGGSSPGGGGTTGGSAGAGVGAGGASGAGASMGGAAGAGAGGALAGGGSAGTSGGSPVAGGGGSGGASSGSAVFTVNQQLASKVQASAPGTIGIVTWSIDKPDLDAAHIEFGLDTNYGMKAPVDLAIPEYRTLLLGMKPAKSYHFRIVASAGTTTYTSMDYMIETGPATTLVRIGTFDTAANQAARKRGFILSSYWAGQGADVPFIIDADGEIVWWYDSSMTGGIARAVMSADGKNLWMITADNRGSTLQRVSMDTLDQKTYSNVGSHDITPVSGELMAFLEYGESDCDSIFEISPSGEAREVFESAGVVNSSGCHGNALRYSQTEDLYTFSDVSQDILAVDRMGAVKWRLTERVSGGVSAWGGSQHGHHLLKDSIVVFANRGAGSEASSVVEYKLADGSEVLNYDSGLFTANLGDVQRLPGGNTLVTYSNASIVHEIDPQGELVMEFSGAMGTRLGYALWRESLYGPPPDILQD